MLIHSFAWFTQITDKCLVISSAYYFVPYNNYFHWITSFICTRNSVEMIFLAWHNWNKEKMSRKNINHLCFIVYPKVQKKITKTSAYNENLLVFGCRELTTKIYHVVYVLVYYLLSKTLLHNHKGITNNIVQLIH